MMLKVERWKLALSNFHIQNFHQISINFSFVDAKKKIHVSSCLTVHRGLTAGSFTEGTYAGCTCIGLGKHRARRIHTGEKAKDVDVLLNVLNPRWAVMKCLWCISVSVESSKLPNRLLINSTEAKFHGPFLTGSPLAPPWCADKLQTGIRENGELKRM